MIPTQALAAVTTQELSRAASLFSSIKQVRVKQSNIDEKVLDSAFESHVTQVLEKLDKRLPSLEISALKDAEILMARHGLYDAAFQQAILLSHMKIPTLGDILKEIRTVHSKIITDFYKLIDDNQKEISHLKNQVFELQESYSELNQDKIELNNKYKILEKEYTIQNSELQDCKAKLYDKTHELVSLKESIKLNNNNNKFNNSYKSMQFSTDHYNNETMQGNKKTGTTPVGTPKKRNIMNDTVSSIARNLILNDTLKSPNNLNFNSTMNSNTNTNRSMITMPENWLYTFRVDMQLAIDNNKIRNITINECKELITKYYESKLIANNKVLLTKNSNIPFETMEQHIYRTNETKYGLRNLAIEYSAQFFQSLKKYSLINNYILIFYEIYKNNIEENFYLIQNELILSINDLLLINIITKYPNKNQIQLHELLTNKLTNDYIYENEWIDIMNYLYDENDSLIICLLLKKTSQLEYLNNKNEILLKAQNNSQLNKNELSITNFLTNQIFDLPNITNEETDNLLNKYSLKLNNKKFSIGTNLYSTSTSMNNTNTINNYSMRNSQTITNNDEKKLGYSSPSLKNSSKNINLSQNSMKKTINKDNKIIYKLKYDTLLKIVLDFQLSSHERYLLIYKTIFHNIDTNCDGILSIKDFFLCYTQLKAATNSNSNSNQNSNLNELLNETKTIAETSINELENFANIVKLIDPMETDIITFSGAATVLSQMGLKLANNYSNNNQFDQTN